MAKMTLPPMVDDIGIAVIEHGERGPDLDPEHPEACLCGQEMYYLLCDGPGIGDLTLRPDDFGFAAQQADIINETGA